MNECNGYLYAELAEGLYGEALGGDVWHEPDGGEGILRHGGGGDGPLQQSGQQGQHHVLRVRTQVHVSGYVRQRDHHILTDRLKK